MTRTRLAALSAVYLSGLTFASSPRALTAFTDYNGTFIDDDTDANAGGPAEMTEVKKPDDAAGTGATQLQAANPDGGTPQADSANAGGNIDGNDTGQAQQA